MRACATLRVISVLIFVTLALEPLVGQNYENQSLKSIVTRNTQIDAMGIEERQYREWREALH